MVQSMVKVCILTSTFPCTAVISFRMERKAFWHLYDLIWDDPIFFSTGICPQLPPKYQLATFLIQCSSESAVKTASVLSISEGSIYTCTCCISQAFRHIQDRHLAWPGELCHEFLSEEMEVWGFPGCLGSRDGSYIHLMDRPTKNGYVYWCRKKFYVVHDALLALLVFILTCCQLIIQATVNHRAIFTLYDFG